MRLFIAVTFDESTIASLVELQEKLRSAANKGNFSLRENLHLTLAFLGEVDADALDPIKKVMDRLSFPPSRLLFTEMGLFPHSDGDLWWVGIQADSSFFRMQRKLIRELRKSHYKPDTKPFIPHLTIARKVVLRDKEDIRRLAGPIKPFETQVGSIILMQSQTIEGKLTYTPLYTKRLLE